MRLKLQFGLNEPKREVNWWDTIKNFPTMVLYKNRKWRFTYYEPDETKQSDFICTFSEILSSGLTYHIATYQNIDYLFDTGWGGSCECGQAYEPGSRHMFFCNKWSKP
jgi:hypothetical protein